MPVTLPLEVYEVFEDEFGKENAKKVVKSLESTISDITEYKWKATKDELLAAIRSEFITRELFEQNINTLRVEMQKDKAELIGRMDRDKAELIGRMDRDKAELIGRMDRDKAEIEGKIEKINMKLNFLLILMIIALTLMNPVMAEIIKHFLSL